MCSTVCMSILNPGGWFNSLYSDTIMNEAVEVVSGSIL